MKNAHFSSGISVYCRQFSIRLSTDLRAGQRNYLQFAFDSEDVTTLYFDGAAEYTTVHFLFSGDLRYQQSCNDGDSFSANTIDICAAYFAKLELLFGAGISLMG